jgi:hypothetical protein
MYLSSWPVTSRGIVGWDAKALICVDAPSSEEQVEYTTRPANFQTPTGNDFRLQLHLLLPGLNIKNLNYRVLVRDRDLLQIHFYRLDRGCSRGIFRVAFDLDFLTIVVQPIIGPRQFQVVACGSDFPNFHSSLRTAADQCVIVADKCQVPHGVGVSDELTDGSRSIVRSIGRM